jgi:hypothetical protein
MGGGRGAGMNGGERRDVGYVGGRVIDEGLGWCYW